AKDLARSDSHGGQEAPSACSRRARWDARTATVSIESCWDHDGWASPRKLETAEYRRTQVLEEHVWSAGATPRHCRTRQHRAKGRSSKTSSQWLEFQKAALFYQKWAGERCWLAQDRPGRKSEVFR